MTPHRCLRAVCFASLFGIAGTANAQSSSHLRGAVPDSQVVTPGARYAAGSFKAFMGGNAYRKLWTTPIKVEVADLATLGGGLTPIRVGGSNQTKVLHVRGADGKRYVFRSVDKFASRGIPEMVRGTPYESVLQDQVSSLHPTAALVVGPLLRAVEVLHVEPRLFVIPDDPRLGEYRREFSGMLALFEERPGDAPDNQEGFAGSNLIVGSEQLFELIEADGSNRVNALAFLSARMVDIFLGDRDRSIDNWWWARYDSETGYEWYPIPRDRDQAFIRLEGFLKIILGFYEPELAAVGEDFSSSNIVGLTRSAWDLDRRFLVEIERTSWDSVAYDLQRRLTDSVIDASVANMPVEHFELIGPQLAATLKERRDRIPQAAAEFYRIVSEYADVHGTDEAEQAVVSRFENGDVEVSLYRLAALGDGSIPYFSRVFRHRETREIRLYLHGGADGATVLGRAARSITVRVMGGEGPDILIDSSNTDGATRFYDLDGTQFVTGPSTIVRHRDVQPPVAWSEEAPQHPDWGSRWSQAPGINIHPDLGLLVVLGANRTNYGFLKEPYKSRIELRAGYATGPPGFLLDYRHGFRDVIPHVHPSIRARLSEIDIVNFFGFGNNTPKPPDRNFFKLQQKLLLFEPSLTFSNAGPLQVTLGPVVKRATADTTIRTPNFLANEQPYGSGGFTTFGAQAGFAIDTRNDAAAPTRGIHLTAGGSAYPAWGDVERGAFGEIHGEVSTYFSPDASGNQTLALRIGAKKVFGTAPFYESAFLGGRYTVRGFHEQRFAGDAAVYGNAELRMFVTRFSWLVPGDFGVLAMTDVGRVFVKGESSSRLHAAYGFGIWIAPFRRANTLTATAAKSKERWRFYFGSGFMF